MFNFFAKGWGIFGNLFPDDFISLLFFGEPKYPSKD